MASLVKPIYGVMNCDFSDAKPLVIEDWIEKSTVYNNDFTCKNFKYSTVNGVNVSNIFFKNAGGEYQLWEAEYAFVDIMYIINEYNIKFNLTVACINTKDMTSIHTRYANNKKTWFECSTLEYNEFEKIY